MARVSRTSRERCALTIAGLDPGGGAGIAADLRAFAASGVFGCAVVAVLTVQSTSGLRSARALAAREVVRAAREVLAHQRVYAVKIGALGSAANVRAVAAMLDDDPAMPVIVDPVMSPTRGRGRLLAAGALHAMRSALLPRAHLVTANVAEAEALTGLAVGNVRDAEAAAIALTGMGAHAALVKGGHLRGAEAIDVLAIDGLPPLLLRAPRLRFGKAKIHGGGCTLASLIAGHIARDPRSRATLASRDAILRDAVRASKRAHLAALRDARDVGGAMRVLVP